LEIDTTNNEKELFSRISRGDETAFAQIFHTYSSPLYRNACKLLKSPFWAEEVVQDIFTQLWQRRNSLDKIESPVAYLYRMTTNKALDRMRRQELEVKMQYWLAVQARQNMDGADIAVDLNKLDRLLEEAVNLLPEQRRLVYQLKYRTGLSYDEIADKLTISKNTVRNHLAKALEDIRAYLSKYADAATLLFWLYYFF